MLTEIIFSNSCGFVLEFTDIIEASNMNPTNSNRGGYPAFRIT